MKTIPTRTFTQETDLGTEEEPLTVVIENGQIEIQTDPGSPTFERPPARVTLTFEQFEAVAREYGYFTKLQQKEAAE